MRLNKFPINFILSASFLQVPQSIQGPGCSGEGVVLWRNRLHLLYLPRDLRRVTFGIGTGLIMITPVSWILH